MTAPARDNRRTVVWLLSVVVVMGILAWLAVPFYNWFCRVTGYAGTTNRAEKVADVVLDDEITIRFDANIDPGMGWTFRPLQKTMRLKIGQEGLAYYEAVNITDTPITGRASYNVAPDQAGYYFDKIECFCFTEQTLAPGERVKMPVSFFVDPDLVKDRDAKDIRDITLSYTFHRAPSSDKKQAAAQTLTQENVN